MAEGDELLSTTAPDGPEARYAAIVARLGLPSDNVVGQLTAVFAHAQIAARASGAPAWQPIGPRNLAGAVRSFAQDPKQPNTFYAGTSGGGVWKSETDGRHWFRIGTPVAGSVAEITGPVCALGVWAHDPRFVVVGTGDQAPGKYPGMGLFISADAGATFIQLAAELGNQAIQTAAAADRYGGVAFDPQDVTVAGPGTASSVGTTLNRAGAGDLTTMFALDDFVEANGQRRIVRGVAPASLNLDQPFVPDLPAGTAYRRVTPRFWVGGQSGLWRFEPGGGWSQEYVLPAPAGSISAPVAPNDVQITGVGTQFNTILRIGDIIRINDPSLVGLPASQRLVRRAAVQVITNNTRMTIGPGYGALAAGTPFRREVQCDDVRTVTDPGNANQTLLAVGMRGEGVFRGVFDRTTRNTVWTRPALPRASGGNVQPRMIGRVRLTNFVPAGANVWLYAVMENITATSTQGQSTHVYQSSNGGVTFARRARPYTSGGSNQAWYSLDIAVDPNNPQRLLVGEFEAYFSANGGGAWRRVLNWQEFYAGAVRRTGATRGNFEGGDFQSPRAQHADVHVVHFDLRRSSDVWVGHDGGICHTAALPTAVNTGAAAPPQFTGWRTRSYGIQTAQFYDVSCSPYFQSMTGGGLQDNGAMISFGGSTWYLMGGADGFRVAFSGNPRVCYTTWQSGYDRVVTAPAINGGVLSTYSTPLPDVPAVAGDADVLRFRSFALNPGANLSFHPLLESHPTASDQILVGINRRIRSSNNPNVNNPAFSNVAPQLANGENPVCATFVPGAPSTEFWFGTDSGNVYRRHNGTTTLANPPWVNASPWVTDVHAVATGGPVGRVRVVVVTANGRNGPGEIWINDVAAGAAVGPWTSLRVGLSVANAALSAPPGPITSVRFEPNDPTRLYIGTLAGVYRCEQLPVWGAALPGANFRWQTFNAGLPLGLVEALDVTLSNTLRIATFGYGMWEAPLNGTPAGVIPPVKLVIRNHIADDARTYPAANTFADDPRLAPGTVPDNLHSTDIRVDAPRHDRRAIFAFGEPLDAAEFDEVMRSESPIRGDRNVVYVHVQNRGHTAATDVVVHLYWAEAANNTTAPNLQAGFRAGFPADPPAGAWQRAAPAITIGRLGPGEPHVARFDWTPAHATGTHLALLAVSTNAQDPAALTGGGMTDVVATLAGANRHVAVRIEAAVQNPIFLRDGVEDAGVPGAVAWGGRSPDIVVLTAAPPANPHTVAALNDLLDPRLADHVQVGANHVIVRAHNRTATPVQADVQVFQVPRAALGNPAAWVSLGTVQTPQIPGNGWRFTAPIAWPVAAAAPDTQYLLVAIARQVGAPVAPFPSPTEDVSDLNTFWRFLRAGISADRTAARALRRR